MLANPLSRKFPIPLLGLFVLTVGLSMLGVLTRSFDSIALFWPTNALLLALLVRRGQPVGPMSWVVMLCGMLVVDGLRATPWHISLAMNLFNLAQVLTGWLILRRQPYHYLRLKHPMGLVPLFLAITGGALLSATLFGLFSGRMGIDMNWFAEEFCAGLLLTPLVLCAPTKPWRMLKAFQARLGSKDALSLVAWLLSLYLMLVGGGPGAIVFPLLPLLWCAIRYRPFQVALLCSISGGLEIVMIASDIAHFGLATDSNLNSLASARLGIAILALGPLGVASAYTANRKLRRRLTYRADHDALTGVLNRAALVKRVTGMLHQRRQQDADVASLLLLDIDHFKSINDQHGHAMGDDVLKTFAKVLERQVRREDLAARFGGEEFVVVLPGLTREAALQLAERLRAEVEQTPFQLDPSAALRVTVSIGVSTLVPNHNASPLDHALSLADAALYQAKRSGRNRVVPAEDD